MNLSGIAVSAAPAHLDAVLAALATLPGVEVHGVDAATGRIVVVQEAVDVAAEVEGFRRIRRLPHVIDTALVVHHFDPPAADPATEPSTSEEQP